MPSAWIQHVKDYARENSITYGQALKEASPSYRQRGGAVHSKHALIIGAHPSEAHVAKMTLPAEWKLIFVSSDESEPILLAWDHMHYRFNFNDATEWEKLFAEYPVIDLVVVDWSTAKFFDEGFNVISGNIFQMITDHMSIGAKFYTHCCGNGMAYMVDDAHVLWLAQGIVSYVTPDTNDHYPTPGIIRRKIIDYFPSNFSVEFKEVPDHAHMTYPLVNPQQHYPFSYFIAIKLV
jgi:hypothetical protein